MTRVVNIRHESCDVYIGRAGNGESGCFGNPHYIGYCDICRVAHSREQAVAAYKRDFIYKILTDRVFRDKVQALKDKALGCFCKQPDKDVLCHGDIIAEYLNINKYSGHITTLKQDEVFVFGSNLNGFHGAGSAGFASFGVAGNCWREFKYDKKPDGWRGKWNVKGVGEGFQEGTEGKSYALPTVTVAGAKRSRTLEDITVSWFKFLGFASSHPQLKFFIAQENKMGLNGYTPEEMASVFVWAGDQNNIWFEHDFSLLLL